MKQGLEKKEKIIFFKDVNVAFENQISSLALPLSSCGMTNKPLQPNTHG